MKKGDLISLVVPAYKQENTIVKDIKRLEKTLSDIGLSYEIIIIIDGHEDNTLKKVKSLVNKKIKVFGYLRNKGKGFALKYGVRKAKGDIIGFIDAGMDLDPAEISIMLYLMDWNNADIVVGSKLHPQSKVIYPSSRRILSWGYRTLTHILFGFRVRDTQVGLKIFKKKVAKEVFSRIIVKKFSFDVEVLAVAYKLGYHKIIEAPVKLNFKGASSITSKNFWSIIFWMLWDTFAVYFRLRILNYYDRKTI